MIFLGDSLTEMGDLKSGWIQALREKLPKATVYNHGISGDKVSDLLARVDYVQSPSHVVVFIGTNDVWGFLGLYGTPREVFKAELNELVEKLIIKGNKVSLCTLGVIGERKVNKLDKIIDDYSSIIKEIADEKKLALCDIRSAFKEYLKTNNPEDKEEGILTTDGVHLSEIGNRIVAEEIGKILAEYKKRLKTNDT